MFQKMMTDIAKAAKQQLGMRSTSSFNRRSTPLVKAEVTPMLSPPDNIKLPEYAFTGNPVPSSHIFQRYSGDDLPKIRHAARLARKMLEFANSLVRPGITTDEIDRLTHLEIVKHGAYPTPLNYSGFPKSICTSVNEVVCHGIPDKTVLQDGDCVSIDVSLYTADGFHGDNCGTVIAGEDGDPNLHHLISATKNAVSKAVSICGPGVCTTHIGSMIESVANAGGFGIVHEFCGKQLSGVYDNSLSIVIIHFRSLPPSSMYIFTYPLFIYFIFIYPLSSSLFIIYYSFHVVLTIAGHGVGKYIHMKPLILPFRNREKFEMLPGMVFTIEPILVEGSRRIGLWNDGWTAATIDGGWSAQIEHMVLITDNGAELLTITEDEY